MSLTITPVSVQLYNRFMTDLFDEHWYVGNPTGFQSIFGRPATGARTVFQADALDIDIDIVRANERLAQMVPRGMYAKLTGDHKELVKERFTSRSMVFPLGEEESAVHAHQTFFRMPGESRNEMRRRLDKVRAMGLSYHKEHVRRFARTFEYLASQSILTGKMPALIGTSDSGFLYDFKRNTNNNFTVNTSWATISTDILGDFDTACRLVRSNGHVQPDYAILGESAMSGVLGNTAIKNLADNRYLDQARVILDGDPPSNLAFLTAGGFEYRGRIVTPRGYKLSLFTYSEGYDNASGTFTSYMTADKCVVGSSQARCDRYFGPAERLPMTSDEIALFTEVFGFSPEAGQMPENIKNQSAVLDTRMFHFDAYRSPDLKSINLRTQTAPIFATTHTDAFSVMDVVP